MHSKEECPMDKRSRGSLDFNLGQIHFTDCTLNLNLQKSFKTEKEFETYLEERQDVETWEIEDLRTDDVFYLHRNPLTGDMERCDYESSLNRILSSENDGAWEVVDLTTSSQQKSSHYVIDDSGWFQSSYKVYDRASDFYEALQHKEKQRGYYNTLMYAGLMLNSVLGGVVQRLNPMASETRISERDFAQVDDEALSTSSSESSWLPYAAPVAVSLLSSSESSVAVPLLTSLALLSLPKVLGDDSNSKNLTDPQDQCAGIYNNQMTVHQGVRTLLSDHNINVYCNLHPSECPPGGVLFRVLSSPYGCFVITGTNTCTNEFLQTEVSGGSISFQPDDSSNYPSYVLQSECPQSLNDCGDCYSTLTGSVNFYTNPVLTGQGNTVIYKAQNPMNYIPVAPNLVITDPYPTDDFSATVSITSGFVRGQDNLALGASFTNINSNYDDLNGQLSLTLAQGSTITPSELQNALASVIYGNSVFLNPSIVLRQISFIVNDGTVYSNTLTQMLQVISPPLCENSFPSQLMYSTSLFSFGPNGYPMFVDPQNSTLTVTASPSVWWLKFNNQTLIFSGQAPNPVVNFPVSVCAQNTYGLEACTSFSITSLAINPPIVANTFQNQAFYTTRFFSFGPSALPVFMDPQNSAMNFSVSPSLTWIDFDNQTFVFSGYAPSPVASILFNVCAKNAYDLIRCTSFDFTSLPFEPPNINRLLPDHTVTKMQEFSLSIDPDTFVDPQGFNMTYDVEGLPGWADFDNITLTIEGEPTFTSTTLFGDRTWTLKVTATNTYGLSRSEEFDLNVNNGMLSQVLNGLVVTAFTALVSLLFWGIKHHYNKKAVEEAFNNASSDDVNEYRQLVVNPIAKDVYTQLGAPTRCGFLQDQLIHLKTEIEPLANQVVSKLNSRNIQVDLTSQDQSQELRSAFSTSIVNSIRSELQISNHCCSFFNCKSGADPVKIRDNRATIANNAANELVSTFFNDNPRQTRVSVTEMSGQPTSSSESFERKTPAVAATLTIAPTITTPLLQSSSANSA